MHATDAYLELFTVSIAARPPPLLALINEPLQTTKLSTACNLGAVFSADDFGYYGDAVDSSSGPRVPGVSSTV